MTSQEHISRIERQVMASVGVVYAVRKLFSRTALECYLLALSAFALWRLIWVHKVFENFFAVEKRGLGAVSNYLLFAVEHANSAVQITLLVAAIAVTGLFFDLFRSLASRGRFA